MSLDVRLDPGTVEAFARDGAVVIRGALQPRDLALLEQGDVWVSMDVESAPVGAEKVEG